MENVIGIWVVVGLVLTLASFVRVGFPDTISTKQTFAAYLVGALCGPWMLVVYGLWRGPSFRPRAASAHMLVFTLLSYVAMGVYWWLN